mmetsp:Transcript_53902/g.124086  ORF Transcript_53902/g.124086 Transcript_53902/m.124086 type:complete len:214 (+) Transcript_53902:1313-1954(+)
MARAVDDAIPQTGRARRAAPSGGRRGRCGARRRRARRRAPAAALQVLHRVHRERPVARPPAGLLCHQVREWHPVLEGSDDHCRCQGGHLARQRLAQAQDAAHHRARFKRACRRLPAQREHGQRPRAHRLHRRRAGEAQHVRRVRGGARGAQGGAPRDEGAHRAHHRAGVSSDAPVLAAEPRGDHHRAVCRGGEAGRRVRREAQRRADSAAEDG